MNRFPAAVSGVLNHFAPVFSRRVWARAQVLVTGAILAPGARTVTAALRVTGRAQARNYSSFHRVLSRASWRPREFSRILFGLLIDRFVPEGEPVIVGIDETLERRRGARIEAKGIYRDNARSSKSIQVRSHGLRWISVMLLTRVPWAQRVWALPFLTLLVPSRKYCTQRARPYKTISHWGRQAILQVVRWLGRERRLVVVADNNYSAIELLDDARRFGATVVTRLRLDAALYDPAPTKEEFRKKHPRGRLPKKGARHPTLLDRLKDPKTPWRKESIAWYGGKMREIEWITGTAIWFHNGLPPVPIRWVLIRDPKGKFEPQALVCNTPEVSAEQMTQWFLLRWQVEVTFAEVRAHLGVETQRQWSEKAIERTTPALFALFSIVTLCAWESLGNTPLPVRRAAWYPKSAATFSDTLAFVREQLWPLAIKPTSAARGEVLLIPPALARRWSDALAFAA